ncbi:unnamed protein product, partial [Mesorhabditis spiculigera]
MRVFIFLLLFGLICARSIIPGKNVLDEAEESVLFSSPGFPGQYGNSESVYYNYTVNAGHYIRLTFLSFHTENAVDRLRIYDGPDSSYTVLADLSGSKTGTVITSSGPSIYMDFETDIINVDRGFLGRYETFEVGTTPGTDNGCGKSHFTADKFEGITSPNWPQNYTTNLDCNYYLEVPAGQTMQLVFDAFETEHYDYLRVYDGADDQGNLLADLHDSPATPIYFTSTGSKMYLAFSPKIDTKEKVN